MKALLVLIGSMIFPAVGYYLDWRLKHKDRKLLKKQTSTNKLS